MWKTEINSSSNYWRELLKYKSTPPNFTIMLVVSCKIRKMWSNLGISVVPTKDISTIKSNGCNGRVWIRVILNPSYIKPLFFIIAFLYGFLHLVRDSDFRIISLIMLLISQIWKEICNSASFFFGMNLVESILVDIVVFY